MLLPASLLSHIKDMCWILTKYKACSSVFLCKVPGAKFSPQPLRAWLRFDLAGAACTGTWGSRSAYLWFPSSPSQLLQETAAFTV